MELTEERLLESSARAEYKPLTLDEIKQILKNQDDAKALPEAQKCRDYWFDKFTTLRKLWIDFQDELHNSSDDATGARHDLFKAIFTDDELQKILDGKYE